MSSRRNLMCVLLAIAGSVAASPQPTARSQPATANTPTPQVGAPPFASSRDASGQSDSSVTVPRGLALLVGIDKYARSGDELKWWDLKTDLDILSMRRVLIEKFKFSEEDICVLRDGQATKPEIIRAFRQHLIQQAAPGSAVVFHFSGHGQQIRDLSGDEFDGLDESLVPFDYVSQRADDGLRTNITDDELDGLLRELRGKLGGPDETRGSVLVVLDSCHSGTGSRGRLRARGRGWDETLDGPWPKVNRAVKPPVGSGWIDSKPGAGHVLIAACQSDQLAQQDYFVLGESSNGAVSSAMGGVLSYNLTRSLNEAGNDTTYRSLMESLTLRIAARYPGQYPSIEGDADTVIMSGRAIRVPPYALVSQVEGDTLTLEAGLLHACSEGSHYDLYPAGSDTFGPQSRIGSACLTELSALSSKAILTEPFRGELSREKLLHARAVETQHNFGESRLRLFCVGLSDADRQELDLAGLSVVQMDSVNAENYDMRLFRVSPVDLPRMRGVLAPNVSLNDLVLERYDGLVLLARRGDLAETNDSFSKELERELIGCWRRNFLEKLRNTDQQHRLALDIRLVPKVNRQQQSAAAAELELRLGDRVKLEIRNRSQFSKLWVTVLELTPDGRIVDIFPNNDDTASNIVAADGEWHAVPDQFEITAPLGRYLWKAIATTGPSNFRKLVHSREVGLRGAASEATDAIEAWKHARGSGAAPHPLARLLAYGRIGADPETRSRRITAPLGDWTTAELWYATSE